ncbi:MAG: signal peptidase II [bacterium]
MFYILGIIILVIDQITKLLVANNFQLGESRAIINNIFHLTFVKNRGAAFGILAGQQTLFLALTVLIIIALIIFRYYSNKSIYLDTGITLIIAGGIGNLIDRIRLGYVIDFLDFRIWPVFNLADSAVVIGMVFLIYFILKDEFYKQAVDSSD